MEYRLLKISYIILLTFISIVFVFAGLDKIINRGDMFTLFNGVGIPRSLMVLTGFSEIVLACLLHVRYFTKLALQALIFILVIALIITVSDRQYVYALFSLMMLIITSVTHYVGYLVHKEKYPNGKRN